HLQLPVPVGLLFGIGMLLLEGVQSFAHVISELFPNEADAIEVIRVLGLPGILHLRVAQFFKELGLAHGVRLAVEMRLQAAAGLDGLVRWRGDQPRGAERSYEKPRPPHRITFSVQARALALCCAAELATPDRDSCSGPDQETSGRPRARAW